MSSIFLSHSSKDKDFVRNLARDLERYGADIWLDEAEMRVGDSLVSKIGAGINDFEYLGVVLSPYSVKSEWVQKEVEIALNEEINGTKIKVLPILKRKCEIPTFLKGKVYADFSLKSKKQDSLNKVVKALGLDPANRHRVPGERMIIMRDLRKKIKLYFKPRHCEVEFWDDGSGLDNITVHNGDGTFSLYSWETMPTPYDIIDEIFGFKGKDKIKDIQIIEGGPFPSAERDELINTLKKEHKLDQDVPLYEWRKMDGKYITAIDIYDQWLFDISTVCLSSKVI